MDSAANIKESQFSDKMVDNELLNYILIKINMMLIHTARDLIRLPIKSDSVAKFREKHFEPLEGKFERESFNGKRLYIPDIRFSIYIFAKVIELLVIARYILVLVNLSSFAEQQTFVSATKGYTPLMRDIRVNGGSYKNLECNGSVLPDEQNIELLVSDRYHGFRVWNNSLSLIHNQWLTYILMPELTQAAQILKPECRVLLFVLAFSTVSLGLIGGVFMPFYITFDSPVLSFIFDPEFESFRYRYQLRECFKMTRFSFSNDKSLFSWKAKSRGKLAANDHVDHLDELYISETNNMVRGQEWRRLLFFINTMSQLGIGLTIALSVVSMIVYNLSLTPVDLNMELNRLKNGTSLQLSKSEVCPDLPIDKLVNEYLMDMIDRSAFSGSLLTYEGDRKEWLQDRPFQPTSISGIFYPIFGLCLFFVITHGSIFPAAFVSSIIDLSLGLIELQMQLQIGAHILRYYHFKVKTISLNDDKTGCTSRRSHWLSRLATKYKKVETNSRYMDIEIDEAIDYLLENWEGRTRLCQLIAVRLINKDLQSDRIRATTTKFMVSTYVKMRTFDRQVELYGLAVNFCIFFGVVQAVIMIASTINLEGGNIKYGVAMSGLAIANMFLLGSSFFQSQGKKLVAPIYSNLAWCMLSKDPIINHLALLWRRQVAEISTESTSTIAFRFNHILISYASTLNFNLTMISVYALMLQRRL